MRVVLTALWLLFIMMMMTKKVQTLQQQQQQRQQEQYIDNNFSVQIANDDDETIQCFIIPHSHVDPGWLGE
jgi:hypothetical protein